MPDALVERESALDPDVPSDCPGNEFVEKIVVGARSDAVRTRALVAAVLLGTFMCILAVSVIGVTLPKIQSGLKIEFSDLQWVAGVYTLCLSALMLSSGPLGERFGQEKTWLAGVAVFLLGSCLCASAHTLQVLIVGRAMQGSGAAFVIPGALAILSRSFPDPVTRARVIGVWSAISNIALIFGPMIGGLVVDRLGWQSVFLGIIPIGVAVLVLGIIGRPRVANPKVAKLDPFGQILSAVFLGTLTYALITAGRTGWDQAHLLMPIGVALGALILFVLVERRTTNPVFRLELFKSKAFAASNFASFVIGLAAYPLSVFLPLFLQRVQGWSASETGWRLAPMFGATVLVNFLFGALVARYRVSSMLVVSFGLLGGSLVAMALSFSPTASYLLVVSLCMAFGSGLGLSVPATDVTVMGSAPNNQSSAASATMNALRQSGLTIGIAVFGSIIETRAIAALSQSLGTGNNASPPSLAETAVRWHSVPAGLSLSRDAFGRLLADAYAHGFSTMFILSGACSLVVAMVLTMRRPRNLTTPLHQDVAG